MVREENSMREEQGRGHESQNPNSNNHNNSNTNNNYSNNNSNLSKGKSCKGCLYYSSALKSKSHNPVCVGIPRTLHQVPRYVVGETEFEASKEGRTLRDFKYGCVGYSVYLDNKDLSSDKLDKQAELPFCVGLEVLLDKSLSTADHVPARVHRSEAFHEDTRTQPQPQPRTYKPSGPSTFPGEEYFNRFKRNAGLVASGVAKNANKVGNYMKETLEDILYPYRRK